MSSLVFPTLPLQAIEIERTPVWSTLVQTGVSGMELRLARASYPRYHYKLKAHLRSAAAYAEFQALAGFFARLAGAWDSFLWADPEDNSVTAMPFGIGDGTTTVFQLQRTLVPSASLNPAATRTYWPATGDGYEPITDLNGTPTVYVNAVATAVTVGATGAVTFSPAPAAAAVLTWTGNYYRRVRFAKDELDLSRIVNQIWEGKQIEFISVKSL